jgi:hypothetical protein
MTFNLSLVTFDNDLNFPGVKSGLQELAFRIEINRETLCKFSKNFIFSEKHIEGFNPNLVYIKLGESYVKPQCCGKIFSNNTKNLKDNGPLIDEGFEILLCDIITFDDVEYSGHSPDQEGMFFFSSGTSESDDAVLFLTLKGEDKIVAYINSVDSNFFEVLSGLIILET